MMRRQGYLLGLLATVLFSGFAFQSIYAGDAGDLVTAAFLGGVPHPPGYPLYTLGGWIVTRIPLFTVAWRITWISIVPHALAAVIVYLLVYRWTKHAISALFAFLLLTGNYLFFLYSITPEVFALLDLFVITLIVMAIGLRERFDWRTVYLFFFIVGLSLSHHHMIAFLFPSLFLYLRGTITTRHWNIRQMATSAGTFFLGLVPYGYLPLAAGGDAIVNWDRPTTAFGFWQLITRADYGTFVTGGVVGRSMYERLLNVRAFATFLVVDFTWVGIVLAFVGLYWLWRKKRREFSFLLVSFLFLGPGFIFYASFSVVNRFVLGTYERFLLPSYILITIFIGVGVYALFVWLSQKTSKVIASLCMVVLFVYPLTMGAMTVWRFWGSSTDQTTDAFLKDLLDSAPERAIILLSHDTPLFGAQYMRYVMNYRPDTTVLHLARFPAPDYQEVIARTNPDIIIPQGESSSFLTEFLTVNSRTRPIATNTVISTPEEWVWVPRGLLFVLMKKEEVPQPRVLVEQNRALWSSFRDPTSGLLSRYNHLMLSNIRDEYATAAVNYGKTLIQSGNLREARGFFLRATQYESDTERESAWTYLGLSQLFLDECNEALASFARARKLALFPNPELYQYEAVTYRDCLDDADWATTLYETYQQEKKKQEKQLDQL